MKYRDTYRIVTQVSRYVSHRDFRYRATPRGHLSAACWLPAHLLYEGVEERPGRDDLVHVKERLHLTDDGRLLSLRNHQTPLHELWP